MPDPAWKPPTHLARRAAAAQARHPKLKSVIPDTIEHKEIMFLHFFAVYELKDNIESITPWSARTSRMRADPVQGDEVALDQGRPQQKQQERSQAIVTELVQKWARRIELRRTADVKIEAAQAKAAADILRAKQRACDQAEQAAKAMQQDVLRNAAKR